MVKATQMLTPLPLLAAFITLIVLATLTMLSGCSGKQDESSGTGSAPGTKAGGKSTLTIRGSDTMLQLSQEWKQAFEKANPSTEVNLNGGGSGTGIKALINRGADIANASRPMEDKEKEAVKKGGAEPKEFAVGQDAVAIIVNPSNPVNEITMDQLKDIYTGKVTNWKQIGGPDQPMVVNGRDSSSGTYKFFQEHVLGKGVAYAATVQALAATNALVQGAEQDKGAIGYVGLGYVNNKVKSLKVRKDAANPAVEAKVENVLNKTYPLSRPLFEYTVGEPAAAAKAWLDWVQGPDGQKIVVQQGFVPVKK